MDLEQEQAEPISTVNKSFKKKELYSTAMKRTSEWIFSQEIPSDVTINAGGNTFSLHKFPLVSKCGYIKKLVSESTDANVSVIQIPDIPGGAEAFELAGKFCYGINFEITTTNIAMLRCVAEYLEMTEEYAVGNLVERTEAYLKEVALNSLAGAISVLHQSENLLPIAEKVKLVSRCIDAIAYIACKESQFYAPSKDDCINGPKHVVDWWAEDLAVLRIDIFQRVLIAMMARGFKQYTLGPILVLYAQKSLRGMDIFGMTKQKTEPRQEQEKRVVLETIVSLLPREKHAMAVSFLSMLLRAAIYFETTIACRLDLEKRMGLQLGQAVLDDLLIPSCSFSSGDTLFEVDTVYRIISYYRECQAEEEFVSPSSSDIERVGKLMENYLAEIASDRYLPESKFIAIAELIPQQSRVTEDGIYRAIDIFLKAHPAISDIDRKKISSLMNCQKLTREACAHASQNDRLPLQTVVQILYNEQQRLRDAMSSNLISEETPALTSKASHPVPEDFSSLKKENEDLKMELLKMKMKLQEIEKPEAIVSAVGSPLNSLSSADKSNVRRKSFLNSVSKKLGKLYPFFRADGMTMSSVKGGTKSAKNRRHSIS